MQFQIGRFVNQDLPKNPGVYQFYDQANKLLYVGKAINLRKRLQSYLRKTLDSVKTQRLMGQAKMVACVVTQTEQEALLLETNLIQQHHPPYNILFRDDKSYPFIRLTSHTFPCLEFYRGRNKPKGDYFGPYASTSAVFETLHLIQTIFQLRQCSDSFFANRSRPCLQHQIGRCSAPCVGKISAQDYQHDINKVKAFLEGKNVQLIAALQQEMSHYASHLNYEQAAKRRDQIRALNQIREQQSVVNQNIQGDVDLVVFQSMAGLSCVQVDMIRNSWQFGSKTIWLKKQNATNRSPVPNQADALESFISQYYRNKQLPDEIILSAEPNNRDLLEKALVDISAKPVRLKSRVRGVRAKLLAQTKQQAEIAIKQRLDKTKLAQYRLQDLQKLLKHQRLPMHMECFDISHTMGDKPKASVVVFKEGLPSTSDYRLMNISGVKAGDDYAAIKQAIRRRYQDLHKGSLHLPDLIIIDGGKGQGKMVVQVLHELGLNIDIIAVAKGEGRKAGLETLYLPWQHNQSIEVDARQEGFLLLLQIRDEAHRFAITGHRRSRHKSIKKSMLDEVPGVGSKTKQKLLLHFGGVEPIKKVGVADLAEVNGVSRSLAEKIYHYLHR